jgi:RNA polymerase sigma factor (sigma-70 family)
MTSTKTAPKQQGGPADGIEPVRLDQSSLDALTHEQRELAQRIADDPTEFMSFIDHELFSKRNVEKVLFARDAVRRKGQAQFDEGSEPDPVGDVHGEGDSLTSAQEILLFQRFNYARMQVAAVLEAHQGKVLKGESLCEIIAWAQRAVRTREIITAVNMPLVLAMAKRTRLSGLDYNELVSEGNYALLRSVEKFDCSRGFKFSTYACRAILKSFSRVAMRTSRYRGRFPTEFDPTLEKGDFVERKRDDVETECVEEIQEILEHNRAELNETEQIVLRERFALDSPDNTVKPKTLEEVGEIIGVTKERVRQIQNKALKKLRALLEETYLAA